MISVIVPVFNGEKYLQAALESIDFPNAQVVVVDDGSTDTSLQIARDFGAEIVALPHSGPVCARNAGLAIATGDYVLFFDADDLMVPGAIAEMRDQIADNDIIIATRSDFVSPDCNTQYKTSQSQHGVIAGCALIRKSMFEKIGMFDTELMCGDAYDWLLRARGANAKVLEIPLVACQRRLHGDNIGIKMRGQEYADYCKIIRKHFIKK